MNKFLTLAIFAALSQSVLAAPAVERPSATREAAQFAKCGAELTIGPDGSGILVPAKCDALPSEQPVAEVSKDCGAELTIGPDGGGILVPAKCSTELVNEQWPLASPWAAGAENSVPLQITAASLKDCGAELSIGPDGSGVLVASKCELTPAQPQT